MDRGIMQDKVRVFAQQLLAEAREDRIRGLGLLVLVLDGPDALSSDSCLASGGGSASCSDAGCGWRSSRTDSASRRDCFMGRGAMVSPLWKGFDRVDSWAPGITSLWVYIRNWISAHFRAV